jgi:acetate kinase
MSDGAILAVNAGSSSLKFALFARDGVERFAGGEVAGLGATARMRASRIGGEPVERELGDRVAAPQALDEVVQWIEAECGNVHIAAIGHRIVHGGTRYRTPVLLDDDILRELEALDPLAPQHQPFNLAGARTQMARHPGVPAVACFGTACHAGWDDATARFALPRRLHDAGVRRYGFHGLSYEFLAGRLRDAAPQARRAVVAHLGSGASLCALRDGRSIDCTMGFSVLDGVPMATRCGALDPGVVFHLHRQHGMDFESIERLLYYDSGLKGVSGRSSDMRALLADPSPAAREAIALFVHACVREIGALAALLGGLDALVFSGGIGAHAAPVRAAICARLGLFGVVLDAAANATGGECISAPSSRVETHAWTTDEEGVIARHCIQILESVT